MEEQQTLELIHTLTLFGIIVFVIALGVVVLNYQFRKSLFKQKLRQEELKSKHRKELLKNSLEAQEKERERLSEDLHDELGAALAISKMRLQQLEKKVPQELEEIAGIREAVEHALESSRRISHELMPPHFARMGLETALLSRIDQVEKASGLNVEAALAPGLIELPTEMQLSVYRVFSELIHNSIKHAKAFRVEISLIKDQQKLFGRYSDDGKGLSEDYQKDGLGLKNMEGRISAWSGTLEYGNQESGGFFLRFQIPLDNLN
ncbi:hypothetical protein KFE98_01155 [bacterium SCSIO 12741]|nr:hypothetical protein KFE98_01155 [bacterium SCSIO 12741]